MTGFKKITATAKAKVAEAETKAFIARLEAIDAILQGATRIIALHSRGTVYKDELPEVIERMAQARETR
jgi:hypothetical protein